jgi:hypothetical protein
MTEKIICELILAVFRINMNTNLGFENRSSVDIRLSNVSPTNHAYRLKHNRTREQFPVIT